MEILVQLAASILCAVVTLILALIISVNLYKKIRRKFLVKVNCWFCNQWTKVHYDDQNCFECPTCLQYNGFTPDGDYNQPIPAQHDELLNYQVSSPRNANPARTATNGLCHICNNNQQLKVYQLANFIPLNEANYDVEIEHFQKQLEKAYKLCSKCDSVVRSTILKQNGLLGLNFSQLRKKGLLLLDLNTSHDGISKETKRAFLKKSLNVLLVVFACLNMLHAALKLDIYDKDLTKYIPRMAQDYILMAKSVWGNAYHQVSSVIAEGVEAFSEIALKKLLAVPHMTHALTYLEDLLNTNVRLPQFMTVIPHMSLLETPILMMCFLGTLLQCFSTLLQKTRNSYRLCIIWGALLAVHWFQSTRSNISAYANLVQIVGSVFIICGMYTQKTPAFVKLKKLKRNTTYAWEEELTKEKPTSKLSPRALTNKPKENYIVNNSHSVFSARRSLSQQSLSNFSNTSWPTNTANVSNVSFIRHSSPKKTTMDTDLDLSLNNLHLGSPTAKKSPTAATKSTFCVTPDITRPRPLLSPSKLKNITQNSWVAGGFWKDSDGFYGSNQFASGNMSRSSSQTSGFVSQAEQQPPNYFSSLPTSANNSFCGDFDCNSMLSEPSYLTQLLLPNRNCGQYFNRFPNSMCAQAFRPMGTFYHPTMNEPVVYIAPSCVHSYGFSQDAPKVGGSPDCKTNSPKSVFKSNNY